MLRPIAFFLAILTLPALGCAPALIGAGAAGGYKTATDERTVGTMIDDAALSARVKTALVGDGRVAARHIDVDVVEGRVILTGAVGSRAEIERAESVARRAAGQAPVVNQLTVGSRSIGRAVDDTVLGTRIKAALVKAPGIRSWNIDVDVRNAVVTLTGIVAGAEERRRAIAIARDTEGTRQVVDNLKVK